MVVGQHKMDETGGGIGEEKTIPTYCYQCTAGPDLLRVRVIDGIAVGIEPNFDFAKIHPAEAKVCVKAYGLIQKLYNPHRIKAPMRRTNPVKGVSEDPGWQEISWDEALDIFAKKLLEVRGKGLRDENGYPSIVFAEGADGVCPGSYGTLPVFLGGRSITVKPPKRVWGAVDITMAQGGGMKCYHTEHLLGELWHKSFVCSPDTPLCRYEIAFGKNDGASSGVTGVRRYADAREGGFKRVQVEPHLSVTGASADEWIPIKPGTDHAFLYAMVHVALRETDWHNTCDTDFLKRRTNSPYLVAPNGYFLRDKDTKRPMVWNPVASSTRIFDSEEIADFALEGEFKASGITIGPDNRVEEFSDTKVQPAFQLLLEHMKDFTPEWASGICDVRAETIRRVTKEFLQNAAIGSTIKVEDTEIPYRPVAIMLGKSVNNGWGAMQCVWAKHVLQVLVGALEVPGSDIGTRAVLSGPPQRTDDGFLKFPFNATEKERWRFPPRRRDGVPSLCPLTDHFPGAMHLSWKWLLEPPDNWPVASVPEVLVTYKVNPVISQFDSPAIIKALERIPFHVACVYTIDETAWFADLLLPEDSDLESIQLYPVGATDSQESFWEYYGMAIKQPVVKRVFNTMNMTDITTELAARVGMLAGYNEALNDGDYLGIRLKDTPSELKLDEKYTVEEIYDRMCKVSTKVMSQGQVEHGLDWFREHGAFLLPFSKTGSGTMLGTIYLRPWYLFPLLKDMGIRFELPYQERLKRVGEELRDRLHEKDIKWWNRQAEQLQALPHWEDVNNILDEVTSNIYGKDPKDYPFWLLATRSMQYAWANNIGVPLMHEAASHVLGHTWLQMNRKAAEGLGIKDGDEIWMESPYGRTKGKVKLREGIRPDCLLTTQQYGHWATPYARHLGLPNLNEITPALVELTDEVGGAKDHIKVKVYKVHS
ncbi:molybdopterin-dependent oxidoreductase [Chloroflexota bacterium]